MPEDSTTELERAQLGHEGAGLLNVDSRMQHGVTVFLT